MNRTYFLCLDIASYGKQDNIKHDFASGVMELNS